MKKWPAFPFFPPILQILVLSITAISFALTGCGGGDTFNAAPDVEGGFFVGGTVTGLTRTLELKNNDGDFLSVAPTPDSADPVTFRFIIPLVDENQYSVTIRAQPEGQLCIVTDGSGTIAGADESNVSVSCGEYNVSLAGKIQKGPFVIGSTVTVQELNDNLEPAGTQFNTVTYNDLGHFETTVEITSPFVEVITDGFYFNEVDGQLSSAPIVLRTISVYIEGSPINVNLLTQLARTRVKNLIISTASATFEEAQAQAQAEILNIFHITVDPAEVGSFDSLDIAGEGTGNAILLAISAVLQEAAINRAGSEGSSEAELSNIMANLGADIEIDGTLDSESLREEIRIASMSVDQAGVRANLETRYQSLLGDTTITMAPFEDYIDLDGDGIVAIEDDNLPDAFDLGAPVADATQGQVFLSNEITIAGVGGTATVYLDRGTLIINGERTVVTTAEGASAVDCSILPGALINGLTHGSYAPPLTTVQNGDVVQVELSAPPYGETAAATLAIGESTQTYSVSSFPLTLHGFELGEVPNALGSSTAYSSIVQVRDVPYTHLPVTLANGELFKDTGDGNGFVAVPPEPSPCPSVPGWPTTTQTTVVAGDRIQVRITAPALKEQVKTAEMTLGFSRETFTVTTSRYEFQTLQAADLPLTTTTLLPQGDNLISVTAYILSGLNAGEAYSIRLGNLGGDVDLEVWYDVTAANPIACKSGNLGTTDEACTMVANLSGRLYLLIYDYGGGGTSFTASTANGWLPLNGATELPITTVADDSGPLTYAIAGHVPGDPYRYVLTLEPSTDFQLALSSTTNLYDLGASCATDNDPLDDGSILSQITCSLVPSSGTIYAFIWNATQVVSQATLGLGEHMVAAKTELESSTPYTLEMYPTSTTALKFTGFTTPAYAVVTSADPLFPIETEIIGDLGGFDSSFSIDPLAGLLITGGVCFGRCPFIPDANGNWFLTLTNGNDFTETATITLEPALTTADLPLTGTVPGNGFLLRREMIAGLGVGDYYKISVTTTISVDGINTSIFGDATFSSSLAFIFTDASFTQQPYVPATAAGTPPTGVMLVFMETFGFGAGDTYTLDLIPAITEAAESDGNYTSALNAFSVENDGTETYMGGPVNPGTPTDVIITGLDPLRSYTVTVTFATVISAQMGIYNDGSLIIGECFAAGASVGSRECLNITPNKDGVLRVEIAAQEFGGGTTAFSLSAF